MDCCMKHSGHDERIKNNEDDIKTMSGNIGSAHRRIDAMKNWVIAGMTALILQLALHIITLVSKVPAAPTP